MTKKILRYNVIERTVQEKVLIILICLFSVANWAQTIKIVPKFELIQFTKFDTKFCQSFNANDTTDIAYQIPGLIIAKSFL